MINPDGILPPDDSDESEMDDQQSQRDIHSNGLDEDDLPLDDEPSAEALKRAYDASESAYSLDFDDDEEDYDD